LPITASPTTPLTAGNQTADSLEKLRLASLPTEVKERRRIVQKQRHIAKLRTVTNPFGMHTGRAATGVSFGPNSKKHDVMTSDTDKKKKGKKKEKFVYDRHGRRHRIVKSAQRGGSKSPATELIDGLHLKSAQRILQGAGKRLKGDPRPKLKEWVDMGGIPRSDFKEALSFVGVRSLPEACIDSLWQEMREGESFNDDLEDEEEDKGRVEVCSLLFKVLDRDRLKSKLRNSYVYHKGYNFVAAKFKPYDLRESDAVKSIISVRHVSHILSDLRVKGMDDWEIDVLCNYISNLVGKEKRIGSSKIVQVDLLVAFLRKECDAEEEIDGGEGSKTRETLDRGDIITTGELKSIRRHPEKFLMSMEILQNKMDRLVKQAGSNNFPTL